ncbi:MAG: 30S ribosomal protein S8 [Chloroflexota bacterium]|nr:30S ribosomal protein S8 [Chloroflexota bacterium]
MSVSDPIADMLTRIRNAVMAEQVVTAMPSSKMKVAIAKILKTEGFIKDYEVVDGENASYKMLQIRLKYIGERRERRSVLTGIERVSKPGCRIYTGKKNIPWVKSGMGVSILSTSTGVITGRKARKLGTGGEVVCKIW